MAYRHGVLRWPCPNVHVDKDCFRFVKEHVLQYHLLYMLLFTRSTSGQPKMVEDIRVELMNAPCKGAGFPLA